ncbi:MAG TPA: efflux RND transporter permease subunit, partial [Gemmatimonadales bacterium]|nr:efflux RND transporter permease subunit [Gemmatimonadales bacterium]
MSRPEGDRPSLINRIVGRAVDQPLLVGLMTVLLIAGGIRAVDRLPVDAYPDLSPPMVEIVTQWPGHASEEVERLITVPLEIEMNGLPGLTVSRSISLYGLSDLTLSFSDNTDDYFARQQVFERLPGVDLPEGASA